MNTNTTKNTGTIAGILCVLAGTALAQSQGTSDGGVTETQLRGSYSTPLGRAYYGATPPAQSTGKSKVTMHESDDGETFSLSIDGDTVTVEHNGEQIPPDRVEKKGNVYIVKDKDGKTIKTFDVGGFGSVNRVYDAATPWFMSAATDDNPPPVMAGLTMANVDESLREHLGIESENVFMVQSVVDGLPADQGGLKPRDIVVAINGDDDASQEKFREVMRSKKPGDTIKLDVLRKGKKEKIELKLVAYDASKLGRITLNVGPFGGPAVPGAPVTPDIPQAFSWRSDGSGPGGARPPWREEVQRKLEDALKRIRDNDAMKPERMRDEAREALERALQAMKDAPANTPGAGPFWGQGGVVIGPNDDQIFVGPRGQNNAGSNRKLDRLTEQLERLNKRLDELERKLAEKGR